MTELIQLIKIVLCTASFILLCTVALKVNLDRTDREKQVLMPIVALVYCVFALFFLNNVYNVTIRLLKEWGQTWSFINELKLQKYMVYIVNILLAAGFLLVKLIVLPI